jgi:hypothetical protein
MQNKTKIPFFVILVLCIGSLWYFQSQITVNVPWWDDFHGIMLPVYNLFSNNSFLQKFEQFFSLNNEHRVVNDRIFMTLVYLIFGKFEMKFLAMLGFLNLIGIFALYFKVAKENTRNYYYFLPIVFLLFQAQYFESLQSLMVPFQNFSVILYSFLCFYYLIYKKITRLIPAGIFASLALFTHGNGILALVIGGLILLLHTDYRALINWCIFSATAVGLYFIKYYKPDWTTEPSSLKYSILDRFQYGFEFLGSYFQIPLDLSESMAIHPIRSVICAILGIGMVVLFIFIFLKKYSISKAEFAKSLHAFKYNTKDQFLVATLLFFTATAIMMGYSRTGLPMMSRYTINSSFCLISMYIFILFSIKKQYAFVIFSGIFTFIFLLLSYFNYTHTAVFRKNNSLADGVNWQVSGSWASQYSDSSHVSRLNPLLTEIYAAKKYEFPKTEINDFKNFPVSGLENSLRITAAGKYLEVLGKTDAENSYLSLENEQNSFIYPVERQINILPYFLKTFTYYKPDFKAYIPLNVIPRADYKLYFLQKTESGYSKKLVSEKISSAV